jgi:hypothetical protein
LRSLRVVAVLELAATAEARALLEDLARKAFSSEETRRRAREALQRITRPGTTAIPR